MMRAITCSIVIECPVEEVFAFVTDARNNLLWQAASGLREIQQAPEGPPGVGARITEVRSFLGHATENISEVTEYEPNRRYARTQIGGSGPIMRGEFTFEEVAEGTRWLTMIHLQADDRADFDEAFLAAHLQRIQRSIETDMVAAKALLERRVTENVR
jgi:uncharacterized protein YndB with AHSA1/START domain